MPSNDDGVVSSMFVPLLIVSAGAILGALNHAFHTEAYLRDLNRIDEVVFKIIDQHGGGGWLLWCVVGRVVGSVSWVVCRGSWVLGRGLWVVGRGSDRGSRARSWVGSWVVGRRSWVVGRRSWNVSRAVGRGSWVGGYGSWVVGRGPDRGSWVLGRGS